MIPSVVKREDLFITSKLWNSSHQPHLVEAELDTTLSDLGLDYLDLYCMQAFLHMFHCQRLTSIIVIHWPVSFVPGRGLFPVQADNSNEVELDLETSLVDTWKAMVALPKNKVRQCTLYVQHEIKKYRLIIRLL